MSKPSVHIVVRSAGERTKDLCVRLAEVQLPHGSGLTVISEVPFEKALRSCYEAGLKAGCKWTMTLDADVMLRPGAVQILLEEAERMPPHYLQLEGYIFDKVMGIYRVAGNRIYRTEFLPIAFQQIPETGTQIRPERFALRKLSAVGYPSRRIPQVVGVHDFEQYYRDLYIKSFTHGRKHIEYGGQIIKNCSGNQNIDPDYRVMLKGFCDGLLTSANVMCDRRLFNDEANSAIQSLGLQEKAQIQDLEDKISNMPAFFESLFVRHPIPQIDMQDEPAVIKVRTDNWIAKVKKRIKRHGFLRGIIASAGALLKFAGQWLDR